MLEMAIVENVQREDLNPIERALAYKRLIDEFGLGTNQVAKNRKECSSCFQYYSIAFSSG